MKKLIPIAALALVSTCAWSSEYTNIGEGTNSCGSFISDKKEGGHRLGLNYQWMSGYITGVNNRRAIADPNKESNLGSGLDSESMLLWLENYCRANPLNNLENAAGALVSELIKRE